MSMSSEVINIDSEEIITIEDDDDVIIEYLPDVIEIVQSTPETAEASKQPKVCLQLEKKEQEKKIVLKEKPNRVVERPYNLENKCEIAGKEEDVVILEEGKEIKRKKLELKCEGRNMVKTYKNIQHIFVESSICYLNNVKAF